MGASDKGRYVNRLFRDVNMYDGSIGQGRYEQFQTPHVFIMLAELK
jgi:hypothetical protein